MLKFIPEVGQTIKDSNGEQWQVTRVAGNTVFYNRETSEQRNDCFIAYFPKDLIYNRNMTVVIPKPRYDFHIVHESVLPEKFPDRVRTVYYLNEAKQVICRSCCWGENQQDVPQSIEKYASTEEEAKEIRENIESYK